MPFRTSGVFAGARVFAVAVGLGLVLAGCTSNANPAPAPSTASVAPTSTPSPTIAPVFVPNGTAQQNLAYFDYVNDQTIAAAAQAKTTADGVAFTTALRSGGFSVADMQVTPDITTVGVKADSIQFSVSMQGQCLIGQYGFGEYHSLIAPVLGTGKCLVGDTRAIDW